MLRPAEKRALDLLADWPWLTREDLAGLLDVSLPRASQLTAALERSGAGNRLSTVTPAAWPSPIGG